MENNENLKQEITEDENPKQKTFDVVGLLAGAIIGMFAAIIGITNILMGIIVGMFLGLVVGTFIKRK